MLRLLPRLVTVLCVVHVYVLPVSCKANQAQNAQDTADELQSKLLHQCRQMSDSLVRASFSAKTLQYVRCPAIPDEKLMATKRLSFGRDQAKWKITRNDSATDFFRGKFSEFQVATEFVVNEDICDVNSNQQVGTDKNNAANFRISVSHKLGNAAKTSLERLQFGSLLYGNPFGEGQQTLSDLLRESKISTDGKEYAIDGNRHLKLLEAHGKYGVIHFWLDPEADYVPRKVSMKKRGTDILDTKPVNSLSDIGGKGTMWPTGKLSEYEQVIDNVQVAKISNVLLIDAFTETEVYRFASGESLTMRNDVTISDLNLNPNFPAEYFQISTEIPDGTEVRDLDNPQIVYEWRDGKIGKVLDKKQIDALGTANFSKDNAGSSKRFIFVAINVVVILSIIALIARRMIIHGR